MFSPNHHPPLDPAIPVSPFSDISEFSLNFQDLTKTQADPSSPHKFVSLTRVTKFQQKKQTKTNIRGPGNNLKCTNRNKDDKNQKKNKIPQVSTEIRERQNRGRNKTGERLRGNNSGGPIEAGGKSLHGNPDGGET